MENPPKNSDVGVKRTREEDEVPEEGWAVAQPDGKKLRGDLLLEILDEDDDDVGPGEDRVPAASGDDLADVMKSFEEEIGVPDAKPQEPEQEQEREQSQQQPELGFLLEASDDELGLPPTATTSEEEERVAGVSDSGEGFGQIWGFEDEISSFYDEFGGGGGFGGDQDGILLGSGLFDDDFSLSVPADFADLGWKPETLPAV